MACANSMAELNVDSDSDLEEELSEYIVELNKLDQSQATLLQSIIQCREDDIVNTSSQGSAILQLLDTIQNKIEQDEWKLLGKELLQNNGDYLRFWPLWNGKNSLISSMEKFSCVQAVTSNSCQMELLHWYVA